MGYGKWTQDDFVRYSTRMGRRVTASGNLDATYTDSQLFSQRGMYPGLDPLNVVRECADSADHPESKPVILALDVTGSMGPAAAQVAKKLNEVMTQLYGRIRDVEFMVMGIGDLAYDRAPIQISQFESDIRIAEQLDHVYIEHGGGGNSYESYTAAWYMGLNHTKMDCLKRGRKALIITIGDEPMNPHLPAEPLSRVTGDSLQADVETAELYRQASEKFELYHIHVDHNNYRDRVLQSFGALLPEGHLKLTNVDGISQVIISIIEEYAKSDAKTGGVTRNANGEISWGVESPAEEKAKDDKKGKGLFGLFGW